MSQKLIDPYWADWLEDGDVLTYTVACHISHVEWEKKTVYIRVYRCPFFTAPQLADGIPQGDPIPADVAIPLAKALFPILNNFDHVDVL